MLLCNPRLRVGFRVLRKLGSIRSEIQKVVVNLHRFNVGSRPENPYTFTAGLVQVSGGITGRAQGDAGGKQLAVFVRGKPDFVVVTVGH